MPAEYQIPQVFLNMILVIALASVLLKLFVIWGPHLCAGKPVVCGSCNDLGLYVTLEPPGRSEKCIHLRVLESTPWEWLLESRNRDSTFLHPPRVT